MTFWIELISLNFYQPLKQNDRNYRNECQLTLEVYCYLYDEIILLNGFDETLFLTRVEI
jgi:hypothetical protein